MQRFLTCGVVAILALGMVPRPADAQVYPERLAIRDKARAVAMAYQRRNRDDSREEQTERTTKTFRVGPNGVLSLGNIAGDIVVTRGPGADATVEIVKTARGRDVADARELLQLVQVEVTDRNGRVDVKTRYPDEARRDNRRNVNVSVAYNVTAPASVRISIESISGNVKVTDIKGDVNANTISGDVKITGAGRVGSAKSISGTVQIDDAQVDGRLESSSVSGDVILRRVSARRIDAGSVSGNVKLEDVECDRVNASTTSAGIWFSGALKPNGRYELKGFSGEVRVLLSGNTGFELEASTFSGDIRTDFPITSHGRTGRRSLTGTYGDGSAVLDLTTFSGSIVISKR
jgi:DUF4097 and DUF4098 domain-containing protein YvlB